MCFRPSAVASPNDNVQQGTCPTCGMPVAASEGVTSGTCPYCGDPIPSDSGGPAGNPQDMPQHSRIL